MPTPTNFAVPVNSASTTIGVNTSPTTFPYNITLVSGGGTKFPALTGTQYYRVTVCQVAFAYSPTATTSNYTIYKAVPAASPADTLTLQGLLDNTTDRSYSIGDVVEIRVTSGTLSDVHAAVNAIENAPYAVDGSVVHISGTETVTGAKTFTAQTTINPASSGTKGVVVEATAGQTANLQEWQDSSGVPHLWITPSSLGFTAQYSTANAGKMRLTSYYGDSGGNLAYWSNNALLVPGTGWTQDDAGTQSISMVVGSYSGTSGASLVFGYIPAGGLHFNTMTYSSADGTLQLGSFTSDAQLGVSGQGQLEVRAINTGKPAVVAQAAVSQSADVQTWQDSSKNVLSAVGPAGHLRSVVGAGAPAGTPPTGSMYYDTTNNYFYVYNGGWKKVTLT
jgi:hypothetical protein